VNKKVCVLGLGYIGLPTAALLANRGYDVFGVDVIPEVVDTINRGGVHIAEPELDVFVRSAVNSGKLKASTQPCPADVFIIAVPTPFHKSQDQNACPKPNVDYVMAAAKAILPHLRKGNLVVLESTSPVGTTDLVRNLYETAGFISDDLHISYCPERVLPGYVMKELVENDRIVGGITPQATKLVAEFYRTFVNGEVLETEARTAEMAKLTENSFRDVNIAFANELSILCDQLGINVWNLIKLANRHPRVNILNPGCGVGGHCIAVDPWFIVDTAQGKARLIETARRQNDFKTEWVIEKIKNTVLQFQVKNGRLPKLSLMGLAFKPNVDDLRESPALEIAHALKAEKIEFVAVEPNVKQLEGLELVTCEQALQKSEIMVFLVAHREFKKLGKSGATILDFCGVTEN
jgi:UDP-N-acetyl-D-mannosaminuronic acid dehydrogenase